jgi:hypothetical protein
MLIAKEYDKELQDLHIFAAAQTPQPDTKFPDFSPLFSLRAIRPYDSSLGKPESTQGHQGGNDVWHLRHFALANGDRNPRVEVREMKGEN